MLDLSYLRQHAREVQENARHKRVAVDVAEILRLDEEHRTLVRAVESRRAEQRAASKAKPDAATRAKLRELAEHIRVGRKQQHELERRLHELLLAVPNMASPDTPVGDDVSFNRVLRTVGVPPRFDFPPKPHWELGETLGVLDVARAGSVAGTRFVYLKGPLVLLQFALLQHALSLLTSQERLEQLRRSVDLDVPAKPFTPVIPPVMIRPEVYRDMARLEPREERYFIPSDELYLVGSAEHTLGPLHRGEILPEDELPLRYVGYSTCFRREAGSYGQDVRGMIRVHQFDKLELESFTVPERSVAEQDFFVAIQEHLMQSLRLPYRVVLVCTGEMAAPDARQIDIETWMPGLNEYKETHTADGNTDFQSRRLQTRIRRRDGSVCLAHMNDATALAMGRTLVAILENYQQADGTVIVPEVLRPYLPSPLERLEPAR